MNEIKANVLEKLEVAQEAAHSEELETIEAPVMKELKEAEALLGIGAGGGGVVKYALIDYHFTSSLRRIWTYWSGQGWKYKNITEGQVGTIGKIIMEANKVDAWWKDSQIVTIRSWKIF